MTISRLQGALLACLLCPASPVTAVLIDSGDGTGNTSAPADDPGWDYVGERGGLTAVYLGYGWVITANHVPEGAVTLQGTSFPAVPGSKIQLSNPGGGSPDLAVFQLDPWPSLAPLPINSTANLTGAEVVMIGQGKNRGAATTECTSTGPGIDGYLWGTGGTMRWGTNHVAAYATVLNTESFWTTFDAGGSADEAQAAEGDSGGAAFASDAGTWKLAGILLAISSFVCQPSLTALYGNSTYSADLAPYRVQILEIIGPDGLPSLSPGGLAALAAALLTTTTLQLRRHAGTRG